MRAPPPALDRAHCILMLLDNGHTWRYGLFCATTNNVETLRDND